MTILLKVAWCEYVLCIDIIIRYMYLVLLYQFGPSENVLYVSDGYIGEFASIYNVMSKLLITIYIIV